MSVIIQNKGSYSNSDAIINTINYITRNKRFGNEMDLLLYGGCGVDLNNINSIIRSFIEVQDAYGKYNKGRAVYHEFITFHDEETVDREGKDRIAVIASDYARIFYFSGFQVVYGIHCPKGKEKHIHYIVNAVNFMDGHKIRDSEIPKPEKIKFLGDVVKRSLGYIPGIYFDDNYNWIPRYYDTLKDSSDIFAFYECKKQ